DVSPLRRRRLLPPFLPFWLPSFVSPTLQLLLYSESRQHAQVVAIRKDPFEVARGYFRDRVAFVFAKRHPHGSSFAHKRALLFVSGFGGFSGFFGAPFIIALYLSALARADKGCGKAAEAGKAGLCRVQIDNSPAQYLRPVRA